MEKKALVLSGGGAKGFAFIGVFRAIEKLGLNFDIVGGTSAGALMASFYRAGYKADEIEKDLKIFLRKHRSVKDYDWNKILKCIISANDKHIKGILKGQIIYEYVKQKLQFKGIKTLGDFGKGFFCTAVEIQSGKEHIFSSDENPTLSAFAPLIASSSIPGIFCPIQIDGKWYVDGGIKTNYPVLPAISLGATEVTMVAMKDILEKEKPIIEQGVFDIILRAMDIAIFDQMEADIERTFLHIKKENLQVITVDLPYGGILDFSRIDQIIAEGEKTFLEIYNKKENLS